MSFFFGDENVDAPRAPRVSPATPLRSRAGVLVDLGHRVEHGDERDEAHAHHQHDDLFFFRVRVHGKARAVRRELASRKERKNDARGEALVVKKCPDPREGWRFGDGVRARTGVILSPGESSV